MAIENHAESLRKKHEEELQIARKSGIETSKALKHKNAHFERLSEEHKRLQLQQEESRRLRAALEEAKRKESERVRQAMSIEKETLKKKFEADVEEVLQKERLKMSDIAQKKCSI